MRPVLAVELDARTAADGPTLEADVCIVGAGPVGLVLADQLAGRGLRVVVLESGEDRLNAGAAVGDPHQDLAESRCRGVGGTAAMWNTEVGGAACAKYVPLDAIDLESRPWLPWSGWPFERSALDPYYRRAQAVCGLGAFDYRGASWSDAVHPLLPLGDGALCTMVYQLGRADRFRIELPAALRGATGVTLLRGATATRLDGGRGGRIAAVRWATLSGRAGAVRARQFVLAAGGIENARLLLLSEIGSGTRGWLGRGFMEHPVDSSLRLFTRAPAVGFYSPHIAHGTAVVGRLGLSAALLRARRLPNASIRLVEEPPPLRVGLRGRLRRAGRRLARRPRTARYRLLVDCEQVPHPDNRVCLSARRDVLDQPWAELHWRWREADQRARESILALVAGELERAGVGRVRVVAGQLLQPDVHHHAGATRMHDDPGLGVVDRDLRVHSVENLFVAGSSVFPTAGFANPTLTAIALVLRLADRLSG